MTPYDQSLNNYKIQDHTDIHPYLERMENMELRWPAFGDLSESVFLLCMIEVHGCLKPAVEIITCCQECVMERDNEGLLDQLVKFKALSDQLSSVFHKISVNPRAGKNYANPVEWGQRYAKFGAPLSSRVPALSGLHLPIFHVHPFYSSLTLVNGRLSRKKRLFKFPGN
jgi:hypothetical protein